MSIELIIWIATLILFAFICRFLIWNENYKFFCDSRNERYLKLRFRIIKFIKKNDPYEMPDRFNRKDALPDVKIIIPMPKVKPLFSIHTKTDIRNPPPPVPPKLKKVKGSFSF